MFNYHKHFCRRGGTRTPDQQLRRLLLYPTELHIRDIAGAERFELPSTVLETAILPLNYAPIKLFVYSYFQFIITRFLTTLSAQFQILLTYLFVYCINVSYLVNNSCVLFKSEF